MSIEHVLELSGLGARVSTLVSQQTGVATTRCGLQRLSWGLSDMDGDGRPTEPDGWDWTRYSADDDIEAQDWAATDEDMAAVLRSFLGV